MVHFRNLAFVILCLAFVGTWQAEPEAEATSCDIWDVTVGGCEPGNFPFHCSFEGSCPWEAGCGEAFAAAAAYCENMDPEGWLENFDCDDPIDPPTEFSFSCYWWAVYD